MQREQEKEMSEATFQHVWVTFRREAIVSTIRQTLSMPHGAGFVALFGIGSVGNPI
jgi:hypothetical protein